MNALTPLTDMEADVLVRKCYAETFFPALTLEDIYKGYREPVRVALAASDLSRVWQVRFLDVSRSRLELEGRRPEGGEGLVVTMPVSVHRLRPIWALVRLLPAHCVF